MRSVNRLLAVTITMLILAVMVLGEQARTTERLLARKVAGQASREAGELASTELARQQMAGYAGAWPVDTTVSAPGGPYRVRVDVSEAGANLKRVRVIVEGSDGRRLKALETVLEAGAP